MASMPMDQERRARRGGGKPPVSAHPAFPAIVALWFAALLGLGSLILPVQLIERIVSATGIASVVPAAAPPLGFTARAAIALAATIFGALLGVVAARRVAKSRRSDTDDYVPTAGRRPLSAHDDLDDDGIDSEEYYPEVGEELDDPSQRKRRRALAMEEEEGQSDFLAVAPLPGVEENSDSANFDAVDDTLELAEEIEFTEEPEPGAPEEPAPAPRQEFVTPEMNPAEVDVAEEADEPAQPFAFEDRSNAPEPLAFSPPSMARQQDMAEEPETPRPFDAPQSADAEEHATIEPQEPQEDPVSDKQTFQPVPQAFEAPAPETAMPAEAPAAPMFEDSGAELHDDAAPVEAEAGNDGVGLVQLVQKLGSTLEKHREWSAQRAAVAASPAPIAATEVSEPDAAPAIPQEFEAARPDDAAEAMAAYFSKPADTAPAEPEDQAAPRDDSRAVPEPVAGQNFAPFAPNMRIRDDHDEDEVDEIADLAASFSLPLSREHSPTPPSVTPTPRPSFDIPPPSAAPAAEAVEAIEAEEESPLQDASYGSLSSINNPFKQNAQEFVRIDEPEPEVEAAQPAVVFPHEEARKPAPAPVPEQPETAEVARPFDRPADAPERQAQRQPASNDDNERALREALLNLQRMSK